MSFSRIIGLLSLCIFLQFNKAKAGCDPSPQITCTGVAGNGDVFLSWTNPPSITPPIKRYIYASSSKNGPYAIVDSIFNMGVNTDSILGGIALGGQEYFYVQNVCGPGVTMPPADTVSTLFLNILVLSKGGIAKLIWNPAHVPLLGTSMSWYRIYREYPAGVWTEIDSTQNLSYLDTITLCRAKLNYKIETGDNTGCVTVSKPAGGQFVNNTDPSIPVLDSVSVTPNGVVLGWNPNYSRDTRAYVIYRLIRGSWICVDTVYGIHSTACTDITGSPGTMSESYAIGAIDSCGNPSPYSVQQNTIYLKGEINACQRTVILSWNAYPNLPSGVKEYDLFISTTGKAGPFSLLTTNSASDLSYTYTNLQQGTPYCFLIEAKTNGGICSSTSNAFFFTAESPPEPQFSYLATATVEFSGSVNVECYVDTGAVIAKYNVMRSESPTGPFTLVGSAPFTHHQIVTYVDNTALTSQYSYYYKTVAVDTCGNDTTQTNIGRTILLIAVANGNLTNTLTWNDYETWLGNVSSYNIYRAVDGEWTPVPIANIPFSAANGGINHYNDNVENFYSGQGTFSYYIQALEGPGNTYGLRDTSQSNVAIALQEANVYIPNAFVPDGKNKIFIPVCAYTDKQQYDFSIFNRWGQQVFDTTDPYLGWDGTSSSGSKCPEDVYAYLLKFQTSSGQDIIRKGTVTLLR